MKKILTYLVFIITTGLVFAQPKIEIIGGDTYDWKTVSTKTNPLTAKIVIKNAGNQKLFISEVKPGCGCTTAPISKTEIEPGDTASLSVSLRIGTNTQNLTKVIKIASNDPINPAKMLSLKANVVAVVDVAPSYLAFNDMKIGVVSTASVTIKNNSDKDLSLFDFLPIPSEMILNIDSKEKIVLKPGESYILTAKVHPDKSGHYNCAVKVKTSHPDYQELTISGYGDVKESPLLNK
jgi:hypothetical protein